MHLNPCFRLIQTLVLINHLMLQRECLLLPLLDNVIARNQSRRTVVVELEGLAPSSDHVPPKLPIAYHFFFPSLCKSKVFLVPHCGSKQNNGVRFFSAYFLHNAKCFSCRALCARAVYGMQVDDAAHLDTMSICLVQASRNVLEQEGIRGRASIETRRVDKMNRVTVSFKRERLHEPCTCHFAQPLPASRTRFRKLTCVQVMAYFYVLARTLGNERALSGTCESDNSDNNVIWPEDIVRGES